MAPDKIRPGVSSAIKLWNSSELSDWEETFNSYEECQIIVDKSLKNAQIKLSKTSFTENDKWKMLQLPKLMDSKGHITLDQLEQLMVWKLRRGQYRPTLMALIRRNSSKSVVETSTKAFSILSSENCPDNIAEAFSILTSLHGVGPATASLILSIFLPDTVPFMSDEAMDAAIGLPRCYTTVQYRKLCHALTEKAKNLGNEWTIEMVEKSLFTAAVLGRSEN